MGIQKREYLIAKCDVCGDEFEHGDGGTQCFHDKKEAMNTVEGCDWRKKNGKLRCVGCWED